MFVLFIYINLLYLNVCVLLVLLFMNGLCFICIWMHYFENWNNVFICCISIVRIYLFRFLFWFVSMNRIYLFLYLYCVCECIIESICITCMYFFWTVYSSMFMNVSFCVLLIIPSLFICISMSVMFEYSLSLRVVVSLFVCI